MKFKFLLLSAFAVCGMSAFADTTAATDMTSSWGDCVDDSLYFTLYDQDAKAVTDTREATVTEEGQILMLDVNLQCNSTNAVETGLTAMNCTFKVPQQFMFVPTTKKVYNEETGELEDSYVDVNWNTKRCDASWSFAQGNVTEKREDGSTKTRGDGSLYPDVTPDTLWSAVWYSSTASPVKETSGNMFRISYKCLDPNFEGPLYFEIGEQTFADPITAKTHSTYYGYRILNADGTYSGYVHLYATKFAVYGASGVSEVNANKEIAGVKYYNIAGLESNEPFQGVNIMVTKYNDGSQKAVKVIK